LLNVINDILDLSKVEAGRIEIETIHTPVHGVVHEVVQIMKVKADEKGIRLEYKPTGPLPEYIESDAGKLKQIITNLVGNAIKFTDKGVVTIDTRLEKRGENSLVFIDVIDTGIGMTAEQATSVFTPFKQADSSITRRFGGTGLGLTISKQFSQALGGDITVESEPGVGSTFRVSVSAGPVEGVRLLSVDEILSTQWRVEDTQTKRWKFPPSSVLVVDDGEENRELLNVVLSDTGIEVVAAENGQQALDNLSSREFDVVLMDVQMPVMDGYTAAGRIREMNKTMPVVAMTADAMAGAEQKCLDAGYREVSGCGLQSLHVKTGRH
jgi:CheY-like chemotaxis protein